MKKSGERVLITGGELGGQYIRTPGGDTHPMGSREKLALFNMLADYLDGAFVLDAFAGSGALGIEAISRGAALVLFTDKSRRAVDTINQNLRALGVEPTAGGAIQADILHEAATATDRYSLIIADPPFDEYAPEMIIRLSRLVAPGGILATSTPDPAPAIDGMEKFKSNQHGKVHLTLYRWK